MKSMEWGELYLSVTNVCECVLYLGLHPLSDLGQNNFLLMMTSKHNPKLYEHNGDNFDMYLQSVKCYTYTTIIEYDVFKI